MTQSAKFKELELAISQAAYPDVHADFTDAGWERMARAAIKVLSHPDQKMIDAALKVRDELGLLKTQGRPERELFAMLAAVLAES
jgi:hypothetical protein